jgi:Fibronectin type III domain
MRRLVTILAAVLTVLGAVSTPAHAGPAGPPGKPENVAVTLIFEDPGMHEVYWNLTWAPPANDGGAPITGYEVYFGDESTEVFPLGTTTETHFGKTMSSLTWDFQKATLYVRAISGPDVGLGSHFSSTTSGKAPGAPGNVMVTAGLGSLNVAWSPAPAGDYPITSYEVTASSADSSGACETGGTSCTVGNLVNGVAYTVRVRAKDVNGIRGSQAEPVGTSMPGLAPLPPTGVTATAASNKVTVKWKAPATDGGIPISSYRVKPSKGAATCETKNLSCTMTLAFGSTYTFSVKAVNAKGESAASVSSKPITLKKLQVAKFKVPKKIKGPGTTVLISKRVKTNAGRRTRVAVTVKPRGSKFATVSTTPKGQVKIKIRGHHRLRVILRVWAPATKKYKPYRYAKAWTVKG